MFDGLPIDILGKLPASLTAIITLIWGILLYSVKQFVTVTTTKEIDKLYLNKVTQVKLNFWNVILSTMAGTALHIFAAVFFNYSLYEDINKVWSKNEKEWYIGGTLIISVFLLVLIYFLIMISVHKIKQFNFVLKVLIFLQIISSIVVFSHLISYQIFRKHNYEMIPSIIFGSFNFNMHTNNIK